MCRPNKPKGVLEEVQLKDILEDILEEVNPEGLLGEVREGV